jgi:thermospermine synthase
MAQVEETAHFWFEENQSPSFVTKSKMSQILVNTHSDFQHVQVIATEMWGKVLVLDGKTQSAASDEPIYHESLVHPAMLLHPDPKNVYIGGGGELATAREILRHKSVEKVVMCDIDKVVVDVSIEHLPQWNGGCHTDPRLELVYDDAKAYLENYDGLFDVIVMDIADPIEAGPGYLLYTDEFYKFAHQKLSPGGILVTQSGSAGQKYCTECFTAIHHTLRSSFKNVVAYSVEIPSFGSPWGFNVAWGGKADVVEGERNLACIQNDEERAFVNQDAAELDAKIAARITNGENNYSYDGTTHKYMTALPKFVRAKVETEERLITVGNPVFMY